MREGLAGVGPGFVYFALVVLQQKRAGCGDGGEFTHIFDKVFFDEFFFGHAQVFRCLANVFMRKYGDRSFTAIGA